MVEIREREIRERLAQRRAEPLGKDTSPIPAIDKQAVVRLREITRRFVNAQDDFGLTVAVNVREP
jgi:hypothetical protein